MLIGDTRHCVDRSQINALPHELQTAGVLRTTPNIGLQHLGVVLILILGLLLGLVLLQTIPHCVQDILNETVGMTPWG